MGLLIGSFVNVVIWRVPRGESIVRPPSACPKCGHQLRPYDNVPLISWAVLGGKCRDCKAPISIRYPVVELITGIVFVAMALAVPIGALPAYLWLAGAGVALAGIDIDVKRLPNAIVYPSIVVVGGWLVGLSLVLGEPWQAGRTVAAALALGAFFGVIHLIAPRGMGMGDVKLAILIGAALGWLGWTEVLVGGFLAFLLGAVVGVALMLLGRAGRKSALPFGPFMLLGCLIAIVAGAPIGQWYGGLLG
jgi:leader peptidase (prepilin peptidase)/N-methyltransferase